MAAEVNILEDASAMQTEQEDRHPEISQFDGTNEHAPAGSIVNQTLTKMSENENEHKKPVEIKDVETGSDKNEVINDFDVEEQNHDMAHEATKISKLPCAEEPKVKIHEGETSKDISSFDQHFEVITNEHANLEAISETMEKEMIILDKDEISRSKEEEDSTLEECREQATGIPEVNVGLKNEALLTNLDSVTKNQGDDDVIVVDPCIREEDTDNKCGNNSMHVEVEGKGIESSRSSNKLENELKLGKTEFASINVAETPYIHHGEEATAEAALNDDDNNNKLENQPSDLATDEVRLEAVEGLKETSSQAWAEVKKGTLESEWQEINVPPVDEINKAEDSALIHCNEGGENGEDLTKTDEDRKINPEKDDGDKRGSWQQNEHQEQLGGDFILISEGSEISNARENIEMSTEKLHPVEKYEENEQKEEPASIPSSEETSSSKEKNLPLVETITQGASAEIEFPEKNGNDLNSEHLVVEQPRQEDSGETGEFKTEPQEQNQESSKPHADIEEETELQSEAQSGDIFSKDNKSEVAATEETILQSNEAIEEHGNVLQSSNNEKIEIRNGGEITPDKAKDREEDTDIQPQKTSAESVSEDEAPIRDRKIQQSFQEESTKESLIDDENHRPQNEETIDIFPLNEKKSQNLREGTSEEVEEENNMSNLPPEFTKTVNEPEHDRTVAVSKHVELVTSMNNEIAVLEEKELAERTEEISEVAVVEREGQEETTATLERMSQKGNVEEEVKAKNDTKENDTENQEVCERPKTDASESKTGDKEIDNTVESGTLPSVTVGVKKGENESCETKIEEEVEATITSCSDDFSINNSEAASLENITEKPALKEVISLNEEQLEASDAFPDMKDFTAIETTAKNLHSVKIDERKVQEANTEAKRDVEVLEAADEVRQKISHDITDQALNTSTALSEVQLDQIFVDSDMVQSKEDPQTIEISNKTMAGDDASYVHAETPFIAHLEVSSDNKKENVDEETDQKNNVEDQNVANKMEIAEDEKSTVEVSKHIEVDTSTNSEKVVLEKEVLAERSEDSSAVVAVERVGQEETTATLERISQWENVADKMKDMDDRKESEAANQESFNELQHDRTGENISCESSHNVESPVEVLDISLKKQEETVLGEFTDNNTDKDKDAKEKPMNEECSKKMLQNDEKENAEEFADISITTEGGKADASGEDLGSTEFTAEEETTTTNEEISQKEEREEKIKSIDDESKDNEPENQEVQVFVTTEEGQATVKNILEVCEKSKIEASESKAEDKIEKTIGIRTLSSVSMDTQKGKEFPEENGSDDTNMKEEIEVTSLTETNVTDALDNFSEPREDNDPLASEENNNKLDEISDSRLGVPEKYEDSTNDSEAVLLGDVSEKPATNELKSINEAKPETSDASPETTDLTTIETRANRLSSVDIDETKQKETDTEEKRDMEVPVVADEGGEQISHDIIDQALTAGTQLLEVPLEQTFVNSDVVLSKEDPETTEMRKTTDKPIAGDDVSYIDADSAFIAHVKGSSDDKKDDADEEIDEKNTVEDQPTEQKEREQVIVLADQNEARELEIDKNEKSAFEVSKHIEVVRSMNSESAIVEQEELAERTEDSSAVVVVGREGQEGTTATLERISQKQNIEEKVTPTEDTKENESASQEVLLATTDGSEAAVEDILKACKSSKMQASESKPEEEIEDTVGTLSSNSLGTGTEKEYREVNESDETMMKKEVEVMKAESENQTEAINLMDRNISNSSDDVPEPKEDYGASTSEQNNRSLVENSSSFSEVSEKDDNSTNGSEGENVRVVSENTEYEKELKGSDGAAPEKDVTTIETKAVSSSSFNNDEKQEEESSSGNVPEVVKEVIKARKLEEEELSERTDGSPAPAIIGKENEAAEPKAGSPSGEEDPAIAKSRELLIEKSLQLDESERSKLAGDKDKDAMIKLEGNFTNANDGEENVEDFPDMNCEGSKEETKITVEKILHMEEMKIPVTDAAGQATGEKNLKVRETSNTEVPVSKQEEEIDNIVGTLPSASTGTEAGKQHPHADTDDTKLQQEDVVVYVESPQQIEATSLIERDTSKALTIEDHGSLTTEENNKNHVDNASPTEGVLEKDESNVTDYESEFPGVTSDETTMKGDKLVHEDQPESSDAATQTKDVTCSGVGDKRQEEETNSEKNRNMQILKISDEDLQQVSHDMGEKSEITGLDFERESTISIPQPDEQLVPTDMDSSAVPSKDEPETIESSKTTEDTPARDDDQERRDGGDQNDKDQHDHTSPDPKTKNGVSDPEDMEQLKREHVSALEDQNEAHEVGIVQDEKSVGEVLKHIEDAICIKGEETVLEEGEHTERTEDSPAATGVEEKPADLKGGSPISEEDVLPNMKDLTAIETKAECSSIVNRQEDESDLEENRNIKVAELVEGGISCQTELTISKPFSDDQLVHTFTESSKNDMVHIENSDGVYQRHKVVDGTLLHELKTEDNISGTGATEQWGEEQVVAVSSDENEAHKLEFCKDKTPAVEVSKYNEVSTSRNNENALLEEEGLAERTDKVPEVIGVEDEAVGQQAGSPASEEEPAITRSGELLNEKSLQSDELDGSRLAEDKDKDQEIKLKHEEYSQQMLQNNGEEKVEEFADMNHDSSKADATTEHSERTTCTSEEEIKTTVEISKEEEIDEKVRSIDDTKETEAAKQEIPVTDGVSQASGENYLKVSETLNTEASISKPQEVIENIVGTFSSTSVGTEAEKEYAQTHANETKSRQQVEGNYAESTEQIESTLDNSSDPKEDHGTLTTEESNNNLVDNDSPSTRVFDRDDGNINDSETQLLGVTSGKTIMNDIKPVKEAQLEGSDIATQTKDVTTIEREEEETNSEENKSIEISEVTDEGLQQESHQIEEKAEITSLDHEKESTIGTSQLDEQSVQTNLESSIVLLKEEPETTEPSKTAEDTPERDEEKEKEYGRDQKYKDQDKHMPLALDLKTENNISDREDKEQLKREQLSGLKDQNEASELEIVKDEKSPVEVSKDIEVVTCITSEKVVLDEEEIAARTEDNSAVAGVERGVAEQKERTPSSEVEAARTNSNELPAKKIYVTDGSSQATEENNLKVSETSNTEVLVSKPQEEETENIVVIEAGKEYPQVHTNETQLPQKVEVIYEESSKDQIEATSLIERRFSNTLDNISELKEDLGDLKTQENNSNLVDNVSSTARVFENKESNMADSESEFLSGTSDKTILEDDKPVNEDQLEGSDAATQTKDVTTIDTKNCSSVSDERQEEETNSQENESREAPEVADKGLLQVSRHIEEKAEITGPDHEKESTASTPQLDEQLMQTKIDSNMVPSRDGHETIESSITTEKATVGVSKDIEVVTSTNDRTIVVEEEEPAKRTESNSALAAVEREAAKLEEGIPSSEEEPAKTNSELQVEEVEVTYEESKEQNETSFFIERQFSTSAGVSEKDKYNTHESSMVPSKEVAETIESSKTTEDTPAKDEEMEREDCISIDQKHEDQEEHKPSNLETENDILDREDIEQLRRQQVSDLEDQNESSELGIVKDEQSSIEVSKDVEVVTCIDSKNGLEDDKHAARTEDNSAVVGVEREVAEAKEGTPSSEEEPAKTKTSELLVEKIEIANEEDKPVNEAQVEVCDAATNTKDVTNIEIEVNSSFVFNDERQKEENNSEENRKTEVLEAKDDGGQKMSHAIREKDVITCTNHEKESTCSPPLLDEQLVQTYADSSTAPSKEDQELIGSSRTTEEIAARDKKSTSFEISEGPSIVANSDNEKERIDGGDQKHKDLDQLVSPDQTNQSDISDAEDIKQWKTEQVSGLADQKETRELEIIEDEKSIGEVLKQNEDTTCIEGEETVLKEEQHIERTEDSPAVVRVEEEPDELKGGSPINEVEPTITRISEPPPEKVCHTVEKADNGSIKEELSEQSIITAEVDESTEVKVPDSEVKQQTEGTGLTEDKESVTLEDHTKQNINIIDISSLTSADVSETSNKNSSSISKLYEREVAAEVLKKDEPIVDDDTKHVSVTAMIEETSLKNVVPEHEEQYKRSDFVTENESITTILTQTSILNDKDIHERQEENFSVEKKEMLEEADEIHLKTDQCVEETDKSTSVQHEREVTRSSVLNFEDHPQQSPEEKDTYAPEITDKADETHVTEHKTDNKLLQNELEVAKQEGAYEVETEKSDGSENILEKIPEPESKTIESEAVSAVDISDTEDTKQQKTEEVSGLADQNETYELEILREVEEASKHIEDATFIKEEIVLEKDEHIRRTEDSPAVIGVEIEPAELKEGSPIREEEPTNTKNSELLIQKVHHMVETADNGNVKEELMECSIISAEEGGAIEVRDLNSELKQHVKATELTKEIESVAMEDHTEAPETCNQESSSITKVDEREAGAEILKKDEPTTDDDTKHASVTVAIEETGSKDVAPEYKEQDKGSDFATENESVTTITTESTVLHDKDIHEKQEEDSSMEKKGIPEEDDGCLKTDYCVEESEKTSTMQHEREVITSSVLNSQDYPQQSLEEKDIFVTEEITDKAAEAYLTKHTTENKLLQHECGVAKQGVYEVETEKSNAGENILEQTIGLGSKVRESDAVSSADKIVDEVIATNSESKKHIESLENLSKANEDDSSFTTLEASQEETHREESKETLFRTSSLESREAKKDTEVEIIKKDDACNISETLPCTLVGKDTGLNEIIGEDKKENNFAPVTAARDVTSSDTVNSRLDTINTDAIQDKSSCPEKNGEKQSPEIADEAVKEMHEDFKDKAPPKRVEHEEDSSFTPILHNNLQSSFITQPEEGSFTNAESPFVVQTAKEKLTESNPDVIKPEVSAELGAVVIEKESQKEVIQKQENEGFNRPHIGNNQITKSDTKDIEIIRMEKDSNLMAQIEACTVEKEEEPCIEALKPTTDGIFTDDECLASNLRSSLKIIEGGEVVAALDSGGQSDNHDSIKIEKWGLSSEKNHLIQDSTLEYVAESIPRQQFPSENEEKIEIKSEVEHHLNIPSNEEETSASSLTTKEIHGGSDKVGGNESNDNINEQIVDSQVTLMELQISSAIDEAADQVEDSNLSSTETLKAEDSNKQTVIVESCIKDDHPTTKGAESASKELEENIQNEHNRRPTEVPISSLHTAPVQVLKVESSPNEAQFNNKALKRYDLDDQCPETIKSLQAEEVIGVKDETAFSSLIAELPPKVHKNVDASEQNLAAKIVDIDQGEDFMQTYEVVSKEEIIDDELLQMGDNKKLQNQTSASLERKQEQGIEVTSQNNEENSEAVETSDQNFSDFKTVEETSLEKEDSIEYIGHDSGTKIYEDSQMDSSSKSHEKGEAPDVILKACEKGEKEFMDSSSESQNITEETKPEEASKLKTSEKTFEYVQEVHIDKAVIESKGREYPIKTAINDLQREENQSEQTIAGEKTTNTQVLDEKINEDKEGAKFFLQEFLSKTRQENEPEEVDPFKKTKETVQTFNNDIKLELKSEALKKDEVLAIEDKLPYDVEGKNIAVAATRLDLENQDAETNLPARGVLVSEREKQSGVIISKGHITEENESKQDITKLNEGSQGKADVESNRQQNRTTHENVLQVPQIPNEDTTLEVLPENAEPGRAIGIGIISEGTKVEEEKIRHLREVLTKKSTSKDAEKTSSISEKSTEGPLEAAIHLDEATERAVSTEKEKTQEEEIPHGQDDKTEVVSGATEIVESSKDVDIKVAHKKHHNILSGVGSKVKHSISKVKKAITGKSSHSKLSPK